MKIYKIKVNGKSYRVELEEIEQVDTAPLEEKKRQETKKIITSSPHPPNCLNIIIFLEFFCKEFCAKEKYLALPQYWLARYLLFLE